ncbi:MAG: mechanosensitive ion channel domain-containing protein [Myxococcota bacterium]
MIGLAALVLSLGGGQTGDAGVPTARPPEERAPRVPLQPRPSGPGAEDLGLDAGVRDASRDASIEDASSADASAPLVVVPLTSRAQGGADAGLRRSGRRTRERRAASSRRRPPPPRAKRADPPGKSRRAPPKEPAPKKKKKAAVAAPPADDTPPDAEGPGARLRAAAPELGKKIIEQVDEVRRLSPFARLGLALLIAALLLLLRRGTERLEGWFAPTGLLPRLLRMAGGLAAAVAALFVAWGLIGFIPAVAPEVRWGVTGVAVGVVAFAAWSFLPDLIATLVLAAERRVAPGVRLSGPDFAGTVKRVSWRSTVLRTTRGEVAVPNRRLLEAPVQMSREDEHQLVLNLDDGRPVQELRRVIEDTVLASAYTPPEPGVRVWRDPRDRERWVIHARLLHPRFAPVFDADLPERLEAALRE